VLDADWRGPRYRKKMITSSPSFEQLPILWTKEQLGEGTSPGVPESVPAAQRSVPLRVRPKP
jgi:hypothetical protein